MLTITLEPEQEERVRERARSLGVPVERYVEKLVERELGVKEQKRLLSEAEIQRFFEDLRLLSSSATDFPDPNFGRAAFYEDHD